MISMRLLLALIIPLLITSYVPNSLLNRRALLSTAGGVAFSTVFTPHVAGAVEDKDRYTGRMGGLLERVRLGGGKYRDL